MNGLNGIFIFIMILLSEKRDLNNYLNSSEWKIFFSSNFFKDKLIGAILVDPLKGILTATAFKVIRYKQAHWNLWTTSDI